MKQTLLFLNMSNSNYLCSETFSQEGTLSFHKKILV